MEPKIIKQKQNLNGAKDIKEYKEDKTPNHYSNDLFNKILHDIRNMKTLDNEMINNIRNMSDEDKMDIIIALNDVVVHLKEILEL